MKPPHGRLLRLVALAATVFGSTLGIAAGSPGDSSERRSSANRAGTIAYTDRLGDGPWTIHLIRPDGRGHRVLYRVGPFATEPAWSPDAFRIAFVGVWKRSELDVQELSVVNVDGTGLRRLKRTGVSGGLAWSPNGRRIVYVEWIGESMDIFVINPDGRGRRNLTNTPDGNEFGPTWSPDGTKIAYELDSGRLMVMNADGSAKTVVSQEPFGGALDLDWSPDGKRFAFCATRGISVMNVDGTGRRQLTGGRDCSPTWSPDGRRIAFVRDFYPAAGRAIYTVSAEGGQARLVIRGGRSQYMQDPDWGIAPPPLRCRVPRMIGLRVSTARTIAVRAKCSLGSIRSARSKRPRGVVIRQSPKPGIRLLEKGRIAIVVSRGPR